LDVKFRKSLMAAVILLILMTVSGSVPAGADDAVISYTVNEAVLPLQEKGYKPGDYRGAGMCWEFARHIYYNIWHRFFYQYPGSDDDMLRDYPGGEERRITAETARLFITAAPIGAVIRLQEVPDGPDSTEGNRHSLILLEKTEEGCTVYHDWSGYASIDTFAWPEFEDRFRNEIDFGYFKYIKYPGARALQYNYSAREMTKEMVISSRIYGVTELAARKR